ncbi:MAG: QueT transporter family protein [Acutalibacteraceae bacterium]|jgi:uncharacterized membrane protein
MTNNRKFSPRFLAEAALIAAMYTALTVAVSPIAYGEVQFRVSELLTILPVFTPVAIPGLTVGCLLSNLIGLGTGANIAGAWDLLWGTLATLLAALATYGLRRVRFAKLPVLSALPAVIANGVIVGAELTVVVFGGFTWPVFWVTAGWVALGEFVTATVGGLILFGVLDKSGASKKIFAQ